MAILPITIYPDPVLTQPAAPVATVTDNIRRLLDDMAETMYAAPGVGLAAPQVARSIQALVIDVGEPVLMSSDEAERTIERTNKLYQLINPVITAHDGDITWEEGCLSLPDLLVDMNRAARVTVNALDRTGAPITLHAEGLLAVALQHEIDHLHGTLILDQLSRLKRDMYLRKLRKRRAD